MATAEEYIKRIRTYDRNDLLTLWSRIQERSTDRDGWEPGKALEYLVLRAFQSKGAEVRWPFEVKMKDVDSSSSEKTVEELDGAVYTDGMNCLIESKDRTDRVDVEPISKFRNQLLRRPAGTVGVIFSRSGFTEAARTLSRYLSPTTILLWEGVEIEYALREDKGMRTGLVRKSRKLVELGIPYFNIKVED